MDWMKVEMRVASKEKKTVCNLVESLAGKMVVSMALTKAVLKAAL